jgi:hypothetical protein
MKRSLLFPALLSVTVMVWTCGCIRDRAYRANPSVLNVPPEYDGRPPRPSPDPYLTVGKQCDAVKGSGSVRMTAAIHPNGSAKADFSGPCIAFIEFDQAGHESVKGQVDRATDLIRKATEDDPHHQPIIITFIHGWKHNASSGLSQEALQRGDDSGAGEDTNIQGLEHVLDYLYTGFYQGHVVIGIYIAWHGDVISHYWPVARTISVYSRERTAIEVGTAVSGTLQKISEAAHPPGTGKKENQPLLVLVGHSFGALVLQVAVNGSFVDRLKERQGATDPAAVPTFADLVVFLNTAAPAIKAVPLLDYLAVQKLEYREDAPGLPQGNGEGRNRPLLVSITTPADSATGLLFPIAFSAKAFGQKITGTSMKGQQPIQCFDPKSGTTSQSKTAPAISSFNISSAAQMGFIQSHELIDLGPPQTPGVLKTCPPGSNSIDAYHYGIPGHCFQVQPKTEPDTCNKTPYWIMTTDGNIIPDHGTIFTQRLLDLIKEFLPEPNTNIIIPPRLTTLQERVAARANSK